MSSIAKALRPIAQRAATGARPIVRYARTAKIAHQKYGNPFYLQICNILTATSVRHLSATSRLRNEEADITDIPPTPITHMSEIENAMAESVSKFANDVIAPKVREMDEEESMDRTIVEQLFEQGLMGVEIPEKYGGAGMNFTAAIVGIEELARVDPSVSVMCDVHNTLVNTAVIRYASTELKEKWLPKLATNTVGRAPLTRK
jgi:short/branched chain acyl-CoA dehydrogenase